MWILTGAVVKKSAGTELSRRELLQLGLTATAATLIGGGAEFAFPPEAHALGDPLPSWNDGTAKKAILDFFHATTDKSSSKFVPPEQRIATFDQDGTLWVEHPMYSQVAKLPMDQLMKLLVVTLTGMSVDTFEAQTKQWLGSTRDPRWKKLYTELTYQPMLEVLKHMRDSGYKTYIVTGGGQDFVRMYSEQVYGIPPEQVVGTAGGTTFGYDKSGKPFLTKDPKLLLNDNDAGKPHGIHLMIGRVPFAAFGNSTGDRQMLEYTKAGSGERLAMLLLHDDATREYAYGPAEGLPDSKVGTLTQALYDEAKKNGWTVISMKNDWKRIFAFEQ